MSQGRSLRLFLVDGTPNGLLTAEIMNWTGHVLTGPRSKLAELVQRPECARTGVYFLVGPDPDNSLRFRVYIGESDDVAKRLKSHNRPEEAGGKDFWERVCLVTSKDQNLTKAHVKYLESLLIGIAGNLGRCELVNGTAHEYVSLPESDRADMAFFLEQIRTVLPVLGFDFLRELTKPSAPAAVSTAAPVSRSPRFVLELSRSRLSAQGQEIDGEFFVLKGSSARAEWVGTERGYQGLFKQLVDEGVLVADGGEHLTFSDDYAFSSPSAAAAVVCGRAANGRTSWLVEGSGQTYAAWQDSQLNGLVSGMSSSSEDE
ncbi:GIY-YIG nuclease family protein [Pseudomonas aeruginosa]|uniref:GIY-YIG nuclease family protein n=1 Tax=Pseudomonas aeruginosa TaxID=287 RepID=UPI00053F25E6|nr:GIY-YIG nuclease family protein [Pseudomonas aeruginosa]EIU1660865.1 GIY-YIG nuclease family protein [Pseudomonas aeruginosa]MBO3616451.1 GIY-YIG nuclease family protein [Pseudomonas aeruginosa]MBO3622267.1 GIY-YIG nuclease family protein [Pseudomonas aeruginosa]MBO3628093.1 GIY-YIG nuclease family protein [Pseudomonas aeruginosa]MBO3633492.1 GIY-YIG nuclease family protein [Pseudomonas aeruginosa]